jgi:hypothetical protein
MATSKPITLQVSDLVQWFRNNELVINEVFQRHSVWTPAAKTYLIDTLLHELPVPKIYIRTKVDPRTQTSVREVVDGQQRVRTLVEFANNKLKLTKRSEDYAGLTYSTLPQELQETFLSYVITVERHAKFQTAFKFFVRKSSTSFRGFLEKYNVFTVKKRFRMADDRFMADIIGVLLEGVKDGGEVYLNKLYLAQDDEVFTDVVQRRIETQMRRGFAFLDKELGDVLRGPLSRHYHLLIILAAYFHHEFGIPAGSISPMPARAKLASSDLIRDRLAVYSDALERDSPPVRLEKFIEASGERPERIASRAIRFPLMAKALAK